MKIIKLLFTLIKYVLFACIILVIPIFLNLKGNMIYSSIFLILIIFRCIVKIRKNSSSIYKKYKTCIISFLLLIALCFVQYRNYSILRLSKNLESDSVYSIAINVMNDEDENNNYNRLFKTTEYENVTIYYHPDIVPSLKLIKEYIRQVNMNTSRIFLKTAIKPLNIKLHYDEAMFNQITPETPNATGTFSFDTNTISTVVRDCYTDILKLSIKSGYFQNTILHEYSHYRYREFLEYNDITYESIPAWFDEGVAEYIGNEGLSRVNSPVDLIPFKKLADYNEWRKLNNETNGEGYAQAHFAVGQLIMLKGELIIHELILRTKDSNFEIAFKELIGLSLEEYEKNLREDMENGWKNYHKNSFATVPVDETAIKIECLKEYLKRNPNNTKASFDLDILYKSIKK